MLVAPSIRKLALTSPTSVGRSVGIVRSRTQGSEISFLLHGDTVGERISVSDIFAI
jgi:hypothetical protein